MCQYQTVFYGLNWIKQPCLPFVRYTGRKLRHFWWKQLKAMCEGHWIIHPVWWPLHKHSELVFNEINCWVNESPPADSELVNNLFMFKLDTKKPDYFAIVLTAACFGTHCYSAVLWQKEASDIQSQSELLMFSYILPSVLFFQAKSSC